MLTRDLFAVANFLIWLELWNALPDTVVTAPSATSFKRLLCHVDIRKYNLIF